jgi:hypothetical protein
MIKDELLLRPIDLNFLKSQKEVDNKLELAKFELTDVVKLKLLPIKARPLRMPGTYCERTDHLVRSRGKVYSLVLSQCTTVLLDKMKQDAD